MKNSTENLKGHPSTAAGAKLHAELPTDIESQKSENKFLFQFVSAEDGRRSEPFQGSWDAVKEILDHREENEKPTDDDYILLVAILNGKDTRIPPTPLITVGTFLNFDHKKESA